MKTQQYLADAEILARYVRDGRLRQYPARVAARRIVLGWLAQQFTPGVRYTEAEVNELLAGHALDHATLRRYLVDANILERAQGQYWLANYESPSRTDSLP